MKETCLAVMSCYIVASPCVAMIVLTYKPFAVLIPRIRRAKLQYNHDHYPSQIYSVLLLFFLKITQNILQFCHCITALKNIEHKINSSVLYCWHCVCKFLLSVFCIFKWHNGNGFFCYKAASILYPPVFFLIVPRIFAFSVSSLQFQQINWIHIFCPYKCRKDYGKQKSSKNDKNITF